MFDRLLKNTVNIPVMSSLVLSSVLTSGLLFSSSLQAADHADTPLLSTIGRNDAKLTDIYAFVRGENLVLALGVNPAIPPTATDYIFPTDVSYKFYIDNNSAVHFNDASDLETFGGTVVHPGKIHEDITFVVTFNDNNDAELSVKGVSKHKAEKIMAKTQLFTGLRDDPFIVKPRLGRNVAAIVIEVPLYQVLNQHHWKGNRDVLLLWGTSSIESINSKVIEHAGRAFRSAFPENDAMNTMHPRLHKSQLGVAPDVMIYNTSKPAAYPNGRELMDDVATIIADPRVVAIDDPSPTENDVPFLDDFPYIPAPQ